MKLGLALYVFMASQPRRRKHQMLGCVSLCCARQIDVCLPRSLYSVIRVEYDVVDEYV